MMQIVIKIDEELYYDMKSLPFITFAEDIIINGTPLPEHHGRLIDADAIEYTHTVARSLNDWHIWDELCVTKDEIADAPTIIEGSDSE